MKEELRLQEPSQKRRWKDKEKERKEYKRGREKRIAGH